MATLASTCAEALELADAIVRGTLQHPDGEALLAGCSAAIARLRELVDQQLRTRPADYNRIFGDLLAMAWSESGAEAAVGKTTTIADGGYPGTGLVIPHRRPAGGELCDWKREHNRAHKQVRARIEHAFAPG